MRAWVGIGLAACAFQALADSSLPQVIEAFVPLHAPGQIAVLFSETMSNDALDIFNYSIHETENPQTELQLLEATFANPPVNSVVILTPVSVINSTKAYTFNVLGGYIADLGGNYVADVTRTLQRERVLLAADSDQEWKYHAKGTNLGSAWIEPAYDDRSWSNGLALFYAAAYGPPPDAPVQPGTGLPTFDSSGQLINKFYFRTKVYSPFTGVTSLRLRIISDEGGTIYVDGNPVQYFVRPPNHNWSPPTNNFGAVIPLRLAEGEHVVAVEVNRYFSSRPLAMALSLTVVAEGVCSCPLQILRQPEGTFVFEAAPFSLSVKVRGPEPRYQWFKDDAPIPNATNRTYSVSRGTYCHDTGRYHVTVTNEVSTVQTVPVWVYVGEAPEPPWLVSAVGLADRTTVRALFTTSNLRQAWATNTENYRIDGLQILSVAFSNGLAVLRTEPRQPGRFYTLTVLNTGRSGCLTNQNWPPIHMPLDLQEGILWYDAQWAYHDAGIDLGTAWRSPGYDDSAWPRGRSLLGVESGTTLSNLASQGFALNTPLQLDGIHARTTYYFRTQFENNLPSLTQFYLTHVIDDGAILYLDGIELARFNMPVGVVDYSTLSLTGVEAAYRTNGLYTITAGPHTLAVEIRQSSATSSDVVFGAAFEMLLPLPSIRIYRLFGGDLAIEGRYGVVIETAPDPTGPWTFFSNGGTSFIQPDGAPRFYRARRD